ncbi:MAG: acetyl-CoA carboxylase carboxyl transferase subunit alpha [Coriobacteriales bacterium]|jgi:acetyl-CoA carboxylase carboxyl transferase subunit beta|nr:acetyl-CoA carboxylase carboxyl transferase subunit alpha [Coriobacteriales bacterium]
MTVATMTKTSKTTTSVVTTPAPETLVPASSPGDSPAQERLAPFKRITEIVDENSFEEWDTSLLCQAPFSFPIYEDRLAHEQEKTGCAEAVCCGRATIGSHLAAIISMNPYFLMGSMGSTVGEKMTRAIERAGEQGLPLIVFSASGGARMQEGLASLLQMAKLSCALAHYAEKRLLYISVMTDPTTGGVMAALSSQGDIIIVEKGSQVGFTGRRVIEATFRPEFPPNFQSAEFALGHGLADTVVPRSELRKTLAQVLALHRRQAHEIQGFAGRIESLAEQRGDSYDGDCPSESSSRSAWERVRLARKMDRPTAKTYLREIVSDFVELCGDREFADDSAIIAGIGRIGSIPVSIIAQEKGTNTLDRVERNFGMPHPEGYRKAIRIARQAEKFNRPVICLVDTQGAHCGVDSEERGQGNAVGDCLMAMATLRVPVISVILGEGGSGGALALALANSVGMLENAIYSVCTPEAFANILWKDPSRAAEASEIMHLTARDALELSAIDEIIYEPANGAQADPIRAAQAVSHFLMRELKHLSGMDPELLMRERQQRFRDFLRVDRELGRQADILDFRSAAQEERERAVLKRGT